MKTLEPGAILKAICEPEAYGGKPEFWDEAVTSMPPGLLPFLDKSAVTERAGKAGLPADLVPLLSGMIDTVASDPNLRVFAWYMHWRVFVAPEKGIPWGAPTLLKHLADRAGLFYLLLSLEFVDRLDRWHRKLGYPMEVTAETLQQIPSYVSNHQRGRGCPGIYEHQFPWLATYLIQPYVRLGRLEFQLHPYGGGVTVWRRGSDKAVLALAEDGTCVSSDGLKLRNDSPGKKGWTAKLKVSKDRVAGHPVDPAGRILKKAVSLSLKDWTGYLKEGETVLDLHIPAGGGMNWETIVSSFRRAAAFFRQYHPDRPFKALVVTTWFMDPRLADILPPDSNPLKLQRAVSLYPTGPDPDSLWFVFLRSVTHTPAASLPRDTSVQKAMAAYLEKGGTWNGGGFFLLPEDMENPRENIYRDRFAALSEELF